jgi:hypothetical protein
VSVTTVLSTDDVASTVQPPLISPVSLISAIPVAPHPRSATARTRGTIVLNAPERSRPALAMNIPIIENRPAAPNNASLSSGQIPACCTMSATEIPRIAPNRKPLQGRALF